MLSRFLPHPLLSLTLVVAWMLLVNQITVNSLVFAVILGLVIPVITRPYWPDMPRLRHPFRAIEYVFVVLYDIVKANIEVALIVLFKPNRDLRPAWITVPLDVRSPEAITMLAGTITLTPGTVSCDLAANGHAVLIHALHAPDPDVVRDTIKQRYERRLKEIFA
ncbi:Na+/H+ antiporter subunit E [Pararhodobacter marinus]|uniref:Na+/H+ antiporter subunit E n=1 Tax=Pararhodobacter marinus TaxID=2184063 RepID=A0A2U2CGD6_9RHOB|nr:Na+/H+ antiporter subunit E [Pararhodobacter marinus]PWE30963.1 Na+/H+ antiporter subunit E [Pararhodobacter marinus]